MKHTALPWHIGMKPGPIIYGPKGEQIASMLEANGEADLFPYVEENRYNAAFIVRACNAHADLVAALDLLVNTGSVADDGLSWVVSREQLFQAAAALAKAKGE